MREIKFRAWHPKTKIMTPWEELKKLYTNTWLPGGEFSQIMQFTGLVDKKGKEIYEGDIIKMQEYFYPETPEEEYHEWIGQMTFHNGAFWFGGSGRQENCWHFHDQKDLEVIGNIYENPELMPNNGGNTV